VPASVESHAVVADGQRILLLGCHDLTAFHPRAVANAKRGRQKLGRDLRQLASDHKPTLVLQHPHVTDTERTWLLPWSRLVKDVPSVKAWLGAGRYTPRGSGHRIPRSDIDRVLAPTASEPTIDVLVKAS
jgi:hypothetical protein